LRELLRTRRDITALRFRQATYILDAEGRVRRRLHVRAQPFTIVPNETIHVDMTIDTGFAAEASTPHE
jgi:hypothetical protein